MSIYEFDTNGNALYVMSKQHSHVLNNDDSSVSNTSKHDCDFIATSCFFFFSIIRVNFKQWTFNNTWTVRWEKNNMDKMESDEESENASDWTQLDSMKEFECKLEILEHSHVQTYT